MLVSLLFLDSYCGSLYLELNGPFKCSIISMFSTFWVVYARRVKKVLEVKRKHLAAEEAELEAAAAAREAEEAASGVGTLSCRSSFRCIDR